MNKKDELYSLTEHIPSPVVQAFTLYVLSQAPWHFWVKPSSAGKYHPKDEGNMDYITSWAESLIVAEILRLAIENVGVDNLTPQAVEEYGFKQLDNFDVGGLHGPVTYTLGDNRLSKSVRVFQVQDGEIVPITGWVEAPLIPYEFD